MTTGVVIVYQLYDGTIPKKIFFSVGDVYTAHNNGLTVSTSGNALLKPASRSFMKHRITASVCVQITNAAVASVLRVLVP